MIYSHTQLDSQKLKTCLKFKTARNKQKNTTMFEVQPKPKKISNYQDILTNFTIIVSIFILQSKTKKKTKQLKKYKKYDLFIDII